MAVKSSSLSVEELDLIEFLADQVALLSSSLTVKVACEDVFAESSALPSEVEVAREDVTAILSILPLAACEAMELQSNVVVLPAIPPSVVGASDAVVRSSTPSTVALVQHASDVVETFKAKPPDLVALEVGLKGAALMWSRRGAWLATKSRGGTKLPQPRLRRRLPNKMVWRRSLACPWSCLLCLSRRFFVAAPPSRVEGLDGALRSAWCEQMEDPCGRASCHDVTPTFCKNEIFVQIGVHIKMHIKL
jgi:hypothetical protein